MKSKHSNASIDRISVIVPQNPFVSAELQQKKLCLCALDVARLMVWWPGKPHDPKRDAAKVKAIQRSLDWKRVAHIAAYLLQQELSDVPAHLDKYFNEIYEPKKNEPGREWPPRVSNRITPLQSEFPTFSNVLLHVNGADFNPSTDGNTGTLTIDEDNPDLLFSVIDGQHRINGAYFAVKLRQESDPKAKWEIPAEVFLEVDPPHEVRRQAQIFIDVNFNQKKVDRSLVADLYPTARAGRDSLGFKERAQDIGRKLMLETGPLVGMIQIPGIRYGVKDVVALATLNGKIEDVLPILEKCGVEGLESQSEFLAQCLTAWLDASGRFESKKTLKRGKLEAENVAYQGRILVSILDLVPAMLSELSSRKMSLVSSKSQDHLTTWLHKIADNAGLLDDGVFIGKTEFKNRKYLGSGGIGLFRDTLWAAAGGKSVTGRTKPEDISEWAEKARSRVYRALEI
jgi:DGQHR domain-containing protein